MPLNRIPSSGLTINSTIEQASTRDFVQSTFNVSTINTQTSSYSLVLADAGKTIQMNVASANNLIIPLNSSQAFPIGTIIVVYQSGLGQTTIVATNGVGVGATPGLKLRARNSSATLLKVGTNEWTAFGDLSL